MKQLNLSDRRGIAFATHGLVSGDLPGLEQPALALSSPLAVGGEEDGLLTMEEVLGLNLNADWVVLSACNTATGSHAGAEIMSGLGRAFLYAGARNLLLTHWSVETRSARELTTSVFEQMAATPDLNKSGALRQAQLDMIQDSVLCIL